MRFAALVCGVAALNGCGRDDFDAIEAARPPSNVYEYGKRIRFGGNGNSHRHATTGWSEPEVTHTWTDGAAAALSFRVPKSDTAVMLNLNMYGLTHPPKLVSQPVDISVNGEKIGSWQVDEHKTYSVLIPKKFVEVTNPWLMIDFHIPKASSPAELGKNEDYRRLGLCVFEAVIYPTAEIGGASPAASASPTPASAD